MQISVRQILEMPNAALLVAQVQFALEEERKERLHFYEIIEETGKMEFINGEIIFHSPAKKRHTNAKDLLCALLKMFVAKNKSGFVGSEKILISLTRNDYEPDICFFDAEKSKDFTEIQMQFPAPNFVVEILSRSTEKVDRETKFEDYAAHGIQEYWIIDPEKKTVEQYFLHDRRYDLFFKSAYGEIQSIVLAGFKIPIEAIFDEQTGYETLLKLLTK